MTRLAVLAALATALAATTARAAPLADRIDPIVREWMAQTQAPAVSIAIVQDDKIAYVQAYGSARSGTPATVATRFPIDSASKQFVAAAILRLVERGKLSLDDPLSTWFPNLGPAGAVTVRQALSHTGGIRDDWPEDYVTPYLARPTTPDAIIAAWAGKGLDAAPGAQWQYSNTDYVIAGRIVEKLTGKPLGTFEHDELFAPLGMASAVARPADEQPAPDASGFTREGLGPIHPALDEAPGWMFAAIDLAMTPQDLARWDISLLDWSLLRPASYGAMTTPVALKDGSSSGYGLGLYVGTDPENRRTLRHGGAGMGYLTSNTVWPDDKVAIVVITNEDWSPPQDLGDRLAFAVFPPTPEEARVTSMFAGLQQGKIDRAQLTDDAEAELTAKVVADMRQGLAPLGEVRLATLQGADARGGFLDRYWLFACQHGKVQVIERLTPDGKIEEFAVTPAD